MIVHANQKVGVRKMCVQWAGRCVRMALAWRKVPRATIRRALFQNEYGESLKFGRKRMIPNFAMYDCIFSRRSSSSSIAFEAL